MSLSLPLLLCVSLFFCVSSASLPVFPHIGVSERLLRLSASIFSLRLLSFFLRLLSAPSQLLLCTSWALSASVHSSLCVSLVGIILRLYAERSSPRVSASFCVSLRLSASLCVSPRVSPCLCVSVFAFPAPFLRFSASLFSTSLCCTSSLSLSPSLYIFVSLCREKLSACFCVFLLISASLCVSLRLSASLSFHFLGLTAPFLRFSASLFSKSLSVSLHLCISVRRFVPVSLRPLHLCASL